MSQPAGKIKDFINAYRASFSGFINDEIAAEILNQIDAQPFQVTGEQLRKALLSIAQKIPDDDSQKNSSPKAWHIIRELRGQAGQTTTFSTGDSRKYILDALRREPNLNRRTTMIAECGDDYVYEEQAGRTVKNRFRYYPENRQGSDPVKEVLKLCELNGIQRATFYGEEPRPPLVVYVRYSHKGQKRGEEGFSGPNPSLATDADKNALQAPSNAYSEARV